jgi:hypothetical protein
LLNAYPTECATLSSPGGTIDNVGDVVAFGEHPSRARRCRSCDQADRSSTHSRFLRPAP